MVSHSVDRLAGSRVDYSVAVTVVLLDARSAGERAEASAVQWAALWVYSSVDLRAGSRVSTRVGTRAV